MVEAARVHRVLSIWHPHSHPPLFEGLMPLHSVVCHHAKPAKDGLDDILRGKQPAHVTRWVSYRPHASIFKLGCFPTHDVNP
jgi:hypothetical protein